MGKEKNMILRVTTLFKMSSFQQKIETCKEMKKQGPYSETKNQSIIQELSPRIPAVGLTKKALNQLFKYVQRTIKEIMSIELNESIRIMPHKQRLSTKRQKLLKNPENSRVKMYNN